MMLEMVWALNKAKSEALTGPSTVNDSTHLLIQKKEEKIKRIAPYRSKFRGLGRHKWEGRFFFLDL